VIDLHAHPLPALDDGPRTLEAALELARAAVREGTSTLAATPHVASMFGVDADVIEERVAAMRSSIGAAGIPLELVPGAEIALDRLVDIPDAQLDRYSLGGGGCVLVECPLSRRPGDFEWPIRRLLERGVRVLLAHPERSPAYLREPQRLAVLVEAGAMAQLTAGSILGAFGRPVALAAFELARDGLVHDLASDAHDAERRPPGLGEARRLLAAHLPGGEAEARWLTEDAPAAILAGVPLPPRPAGA
jgi:protein-tyrosine phosphatase